MLLAPGLRFLMRESFRLLVLDVPCLLSGVLLLVGGSVRLLVLGVQRHAPSVQLLAGGGDRLLAPGVQLPLLGVKLLAPGFHQPVVASTFSNPGDDFRGSYILHASLHYCPARDAEVGWFVE